MAVPKRKTSRARRDKRRATHSIPATRRSHRVLLRPTSKPLPTGSRAASRSALRDR
ncbi:MAG: 50S ribosomal protein L32 [Phycisphaerales bacterium]